MYSLVARRYSVKSLVQYHIDLIVNNIRLDVGLEILLRSENFLAETELIPSFLKWHHKTQKYRYFTIGAESEVTLKFNHAQVLEILEFLVIDNSHLLSLIGFVGNTNLEHVNFSGGHIRSKRSRVQTNIALNSYLGLIKKINGCVCYADAES